MKQQQKNKKVVIIIPTYNERENIQMIVPRIFDAVKDVAGYDVHILVVDDTSPDKTYEEVKRLQKKYPRLHLLINPEKAGLGGAYLKGMQEAFGKLKADYIFEFDADGSHDPTRLPAFLAKLDEGYDFVIGGRYKDGGSIDPNWPLLRKFYSVVGNLVIMFVLTDFRIRDWTSGYRAISKQVYEAVVPEMTGERFSGYTWQIGFLHKAVRKGFRICEVPIHFVDRKIGQSKLGSEYIKNTLLYIFKARFDEIIHHRLFKFAVAGATGALIQLVGFRLLRQTLLPADNQLQIANFISIELAIIANFIINGSWTFADRKLKKSQLIPKFLQFNLGAAGSIITQMLTMHLLVKLWGTGELFSLLSLVVSKESLYQVIGILIGMIINYFIYSKIIWKQKASPSEK
ncbi:glycosyltransferase family 2 protein [bacterium]|nr:glycosyltransferase family 2 protein [bacterium]MBQ6436634.1 glycosyltransferase family 2 protein [bacterium]